MDKKIVIKDAIIKYLSDEQWQLMVNICWDLESVFNDSDCTSWKGRIITHSKFSDDEFKTIQSAIENRSELKVTDDDVEFVVDSLVSEGDVKKHWYQSSMNYYYSL